MSPRDTRTGSVLEEMVLPALHRGGYHYRSGVYVDHRPGGRRHKADVVAWRDGSRLFLVSLKWQQVGGTAEQKVPFEVISLAEAVLNWQQSEGLSTAVCQNQRCLCGCTSTFRLGTGTLVPYLVLGGGGWTLRDFYIGGGLQKHLTYAHLVNITDLESFVSRANQGRL